ncbi:peptide deformylase [Pelagibacteraceae bacterium]|jgi:peptide deformylase|nr:peptide deformylase [Pelagibacteraceae bacterium]
MAIKKILIEPDPFLRQKSKKVYQVDDEIRSLMDDMLETMYDAPGIGLAAIQIGVPKRVIVIDLSRDGEKKNPMYFVNPEIISSSDKDATYEEGCLSVPNQFAEIDRPDKCHVKFLDYNGKEKTIKVEGLLATCIQHEMDHLEGVLFIDYLSKLKKNMIIKKLSKQKKSSERIAF